MHLLTAGLSSGGALAVALPLGFKWLGKRWEAQLEAERVKLAQSQAQAEEARAQQLPEPAQLEERHCFGIVDEISLVAGVSVCVAPIVN